jgi:hypothetical protein
MTASRSSANGVHVDPSTLAADLAILRAEVQRLGALAQQSTEPQSSVELSQNAKGATQIVVKVYAPMPAAAADMAQQLYDALRARYCLPATDGVA